MWEAVSAVKTTILVILIAVGLLGLLWWAGPPQQWGVLQHLHQWMSYVSSAIGGGGGGGYRPRPQ